MVTFRNNNNNNRRPPFRSNNNRRPPFRRSEEGSKFSNNSSFKRNVPGRNNHNAPKLIEKYNEMAREALANEDRVLSENYFQHADHFTRILNEQESFRKTKFAENKELNSGTSSLSEKKEEEVGEKIIDKTEEVAKVKKVVKKQPEANQFNPNIFSDLSTSNLILLVSKNFLSLPFKILPDGSFNFCELTFFPLTITS